MSNWYVFSCIADVRGQQQAKHLPKNLPVSISSLQNQLPVSPADATSQAQAGMNAASAQAQKWRSGMMNMLSNQLDIDKLRREITETGMKAMQDIMNAVAPPIAEHEVIQVNLSHDMLGYEGVETLVYRALAKVGLPRLHHRVSFLTHNLYCLGYGTS